MSMLAENKLVNHRAGKLLGQIVMQSIQTHSDDLDLHPPMAVSPAQQQRVFRVCKNKQKIPQFLRARRSICVRWGKCRIDTFKWEEVWSWITSQFQHLLLQMCTGSDRHQRLRSRVCSDIFGIQRALTSWLIWVKLEEQNQSVFMSQQKQKTSWCDRNRVSRFGRTTNCWGLQI